MIATRTALLLALREGPGYGRELVRRIRGATAGRVRFAEGSIYPALHKLEAARLVRGWTVVPGRRPGDRARTYYELTERGVRVSEGDRMALLRVAAGVAPRRRGACADGPTDRAGSGALGCGRGAHPPAGERPPGPGGVTGRPTRFLRVARRVAEALGEEDCLLAGGLAVMAHGFVRGTRDVDLITHLPLAQAHARLERRGLPARFHRGRPLEGDFSCLKGECEGLPFEVLPQIVPVHWDSAPAVGARGAGGLRVLPLTDLIALKLKAGGARDLMDAAILVLLHPETEAQARELATAYAALDRFETWLRDPRTMAQAREEAAFDAQRSKGRGRARR